MGKCDAILSKYEEGWDYSVEGSINDLAVYRLERAKEELVNAEDGLAEGKYKLAMNRSYYSIFHALRAVNVLDGFDSSKHSGVIAHFNQYHVKNGDFPKKTSQLIGKASSMREHADYEDFFVASRQEAEEQLQSAKILLLLIEQYLLEKDIM